MTVDELNLTVPDRKLTQAGRDATGRTSTPEEKEKMPKEMPNMPSQAMQDSIDALRDRQKASAGQTPPTPEERRAAFVPGDRLHPVPDDVLVREVTAGGVPAHWLTAPGADTGRVLLFLHGGGYELGSLRSDGELAARLGRASGMRVLFPEYRLAPEHPFPAAIDDVLAAWRWLRAGQGLSAASIAVAGDSAGGGLAVALLVATRDAGQAVPTAAVLMSPTVDLTSSGASMTERADQDPISTPPCSASSPPATWPGLTLRRPWPRRCSPRCAGFPRCLSRSARPTCCSAIPNAWPQQQPKPGSTSVSSGSFMCRSLVGAAVWLAGEGRALRAVTAGPPGQWCGSRC